MKKIITLCFFTFALFGGMQTINAQDSFNMVEEQVKIDSKELTKLLNLDDNQSALVWRSMLAKERAYFKKVNGVDPNEPNLVKIKDKINTTYHSKMAEILTEAQYEKFKTWLVKKNKIH